MSAHPHAEYRRTRERTEFTEAEAWAVARGDEELE
jgi:hypothetical protein